MEKATIYDHARMCETEKVCNDCPLHRTINGTNLACDDFLINCVDKANEIILNWCKEHPIKTRQSRFLKLFPNAKIYCDGDNDFIDICPCCIDSRLSIQRNCAGKNCWMCKKEYWLAEVDENE